MFKFSCEGGDGPVYFLALERGNIDRLTAGKPIKVDLRDMGGPNARVVVLFGETGEGLFRELQEGGLIPRDVPYVAASPGVAEVVRFRRGGN